MNIRQILKEEIELAEAYPLGFDLKEFSALPSYAQRVKYCTERLKRLGSGSSRIAFAVDEEKVLKIAKNVKGIAQNESESEYYKQSYDIVARVFDVDPNNLWIEMETAKKINSKRFEQITGVYFPDCITWIRCQAMRNYKEADAISQKYFADPDNENQFWGEFTNFLQEAGYEKFLDYGVISSFGEVLRDGDPTVVFIDFGLTDDVFNSHYSGRR